MHTKGRNKMKIITVCSASFASNTYLLVSGNEAFAVDPSISVKALKSALEKEHATLTGVLLTHGHFDHVMSLDTVRDAFGVPAYIHKDDAIMLTDGKKNAFYDFFGQERVYKPAEKLLSDGDLLPLGNEQIKVLHTPGHTMGSVCYICDGGIVSGDTLFAESFGRCDLWGGDMGQMRKSLIRLREFPKDETIFPGHGEASPLGNALDNVAYLI